MSTTGRRSPIFWLVIPKKASMFSPALVCVCMCLSVTTITKKIVDGFAPNLMRRFLGGKGRPTSCFVTIGIEGCGSNGQKHSLNRRLFTK